MNKKFWQQNHPEELQPLVQVPAMWTERMPKIVNVISAVSICYLFKMVGD